MLLRYKLLLIFLFFHYAGASDSGVDDYAAAGTPCKKIKLDTDAEVVIDQETLRSSRILKMLIDAGEEGCTAEVIVIGGGGRPRFGHAAVFELVVDAMFRHNVDIIYDKPKRVAWYNGKVSQEQDSPLDLRIVLARFLTQAPATKFSIGEIAYNFCKRGVRAKSFCVFARTHYAVSIVCGLITTRAQEKVQGFLEFARHQPKRPFAALAADFGLGYATERAVAKTIWDFPNAVLEEIIAIRQMAESESQHRKGVFAVRYEQQGKSASLRGPSLEQILDFVCELEPLPQDCPLMPRADVPSDSLAKAKDVVDQIPPEEERQGHAERVFYPDVVPKPVNYDKPFVIAIAEEMKAHRCVGLLDLVKSKIFSLRSESLGTLKTAYWAVCALCSEKKCALTMQVQQFLRYVEAPSWPEDTTLSEKKASYAKQYGTMDAQCLSVAEYTLSLPNDVRKTLSTMTIPFDEVCRDRTPKCVFIEKVCACAQRGMTQHWTAFLPLLPKRSMGYSEVFKSIMDVVMAQNLQVVCDSKKNFTFSVVEQKKQIPLIPIEVMMAARFWGEPCAPADKTPFANTLYNLGYPLQSYNDFKERFHAVCLARGIPLFGNTFPTAASLFRYIKKSPVRKSILEHCQDFGLNLVSMPEITLVSRTLVLEDSQIFSQWNMTGYSTAGDVLCDAQTRKDVIIVRILQEYARQEKPCPYEIFETIFSNCHDADNVLTVVMDTLFRVNVDITYDPVCKTYTLRAMVNQRPTPLEPLKTFILQASSLLTTAELAYALYNAGYSVASCQTVQNLRIMHLHLASDGVQDLIHESQEFIKYALKKTDASSRNVCACLGYYERSQKRLLSPKAAQLSKSCIQLLFSGYLAQEDLVKIFSLKDAPEPCVAKANRVRQKALCVVQIDRAKVTIQSALLSAVHNAVQRNAVLFYQDILPYVGQARAPEEVLESVMDLVFKKELGVTYSSERESYRFSLEKSKKPLTTVNTRSFIEQACVGQECTVKHRAGCAYRLHKAGHNYASFQEFQVEYGAICVGLDVAVHGLDDVTRCKDFWCYMSKEPMDYLQVLIVKYRENKKKPFTKIDEMIINQAMDGLL